LVDEVDVESERNLKGGVVSQTSVEGASLELTKKRNAWIEKLVAYHSL
jgi:hypothetical protein